MCSAARLFATELLASGGPALLDDAREVLGAEFPVFELVAAETLAGRAPSPIDAKSCGESLRRSAAVLVVGIEAFHLDALVAELPDSRLGLVLGEGWLEADTRRVFANYDGRLEEVRVGDVQRWAGNRNALLTFVYGSHASSAYVTPAWLRIAGSDLRTQFRSLVGWEVLKRPTTLYPRWLVETPIETFSEVIRS